MLTYIYENVKYPEEARLAQQEGRALISFIVDKNGDVTSAKPVAEKTTGHPALNKVALSVVESLPKFSPGRQDGQAVNVKMVLPISFQLD